jgi:hypothetical protein
MIKVKNPNYTINEIIEALIKNFNVYNQIIKDGSVYYEEIPGFTLRATDSSIDPADFDFMYSVEIEDITPALLTSAYSGIIVKGRDFEGNLYRNKHYLRIGHWHYQYFGYSFKIQMD